MKKWGLRSSQSVSQSQEVMEPELKDRTVTAKPVAFPLHQRREKGALEPVSLGSSPPSAVC